MEMSDQLHAPSALLTEKEHPVPTVQESRWAPEPVWAWWQREKILSLSLPGVEHWSSSPPVAQSGC